MLLVPRDPKDDKSVILEVRAGAGGEEAALLAGDLLRMYLRYAERRRYRTEVMSLNGTGIGGVKEAIVKISGAGAYSRLKYEGGTHRVQRIRAADRRAGSTPRPRPLSSCRRSSRRRSRSTRSEISRSR